MATMHLPAPIEQVWAMLGDPGYLAAKCAASPDGDFSVAEEGGARTLTVTRTLAGVVPHIARGFLGDTIRLVERHVWPAQPGPERTGTLDIDVKGAPASVSGTVTLRTAGAGASAIDLRLDIRVSVPLFGGAAEAMVRDELAAAVAQEEALARTWLSG